MPLPNPVAPTSGGQDMSAELDERVAREVMGLPAVPWDDKTPCPYCGVVMRYCGQRSRCTDCSEWRYSAYKEYSDDIACAWEVVDKMRTIGHPCGFSVVVGTNGMASQQNGAKFYEGWRGAGHSIFDAEPHKGFDAVAETVPRAICLAALKAVADRDSDGSPQGQDAKRIDGEATTARAEGIAQEGPR
jgi:hypothetical protein